MKGQIVITWNEAEQEAERIRQEQEQIAAEKMQEFMDSSIGMLDARDIQYYAEITGKEPNELRRMHPENGIDTLLRTFERDETDDIINFF